MPKKQYKGKKPGNQRFYPQKELADFSDVDEGKAEYVGQKLPRTRRVRMTKWTRSKNPETGEYTFSIRPEWQEAQGLYVIYHF